MKDERTRAFDLDAPVRRYITKKLIAVEHDSTVQDAASRMVEFGISSLAVLRDREVVGFFTDADIKERVVAAGRSPAVPVSEIMTTELITADVTEPIRRILDLMSDHRIKHVLITEHESIVGIITLRDVVDMERRRLETYIAGE